MMASSAAAQSPSVQVDFSPVVCLSPRVFEASCLLPVVLKDSPLLIVSERSTRSSYRICLGVLIEG